MNLMLVSTLLLSLASVLVVVHGERILLGEALEERPNNQFDKFDSIEGDRARGQSQLQLAERAEQQQPDYVWELKAFKRNRASSGGTYFSPRLGRRKKRSSTSVEGESYQHEPSTTTRDSSSREKLALLKLLRRIIKMEGVGAGTQTTPVAPANREYQEKSQQPIFGTLLHDSLEHQGPPASFQHFYSPRIDNHGDGEELSTAIFAPRALRDHISPRLG